MIRNYKTKIKAMQTKILNDNKYINDIYADKSKNEGTTSNRVFRYSRTYGIVSGNLPLIRIELTKPLARLQGDNAPELQIQVLEFLNKLKNTLLLY